MISSLPERLSCISRATFSFVVISTLYSTLEHHIEIAHRGTLSKQSSEELVIHIDYIW